MAFEVFTPESAATAGQPFISVQKHGIIGLNRAAYARLGEPGAVELLFDPDRRYLGLRAADKRSRTAQVVRPTKSPSTFVVSAARYCRHYGIPIDKGRRWSAQLEDGILFAEIGREDD